MSEPIIPTDSLLSRRVVLGPEGYLVQILSPDGIVIATDSFQASDKLPTAGEIYPSNSDMGEGDDENERKRRKTGLKNWRNKQAEINSDQDDNKMASYRLDLIKAD